MSGASDETVRTSNLLSSSGGWLRQLVQEVWISTDLLFQSKLTWLLCLGPLALIGDATGMFGEAVCFICSGIALIPCAERLSFVTEQVASHTNGTIGALLNATFGNAPELLISTAALQAGFYRVVQLAMLGSMLTNLLFVFGMSCLVGGLRWQVQELRITSGNVSVGMLFLATAGSLLPAALELGGELRKDADGDEDIIDDGVPGEGELAFCRVNAFIMMFMYIMYLLFQLGTHKEEFDEEENIVETPDHLLLMTPHYTSRHGRHDRKRTQRNMFCLNCCLRCTRLCRRAQHEPLERVAGDVELASRDGITNTKPKSDIVFEDEMSSLGSGGSKNSSTGSNGETENNNWQGSVLSDSGSHHSGEMKKRRGRDNNSSSDGIHRDLTHTDSPASFQEEQTLMFRPKVVRAEEESDRGELDELVRHNREEEPVMSFRVGIVWLFIITLCISAMSDILVDTIDGFAYRCHMSEVFTSMVIVPFFSNVAEQVSAILFAYRNEMDLCVGVTVGSAIQIATFVLPGCVLIGFAVDRSMTLYFRAYETCSLFFGVVCVAAVLQGGTTNWLVGMTLISIYAMIAAGFWFHEVEDLSIDAETFIQNQTRVLTVGY